MKIKFDMKDIIAIDEKNGSVLLKRDGVQMFMKAGDMAEAYTEGEINGRLAVIPLDYIYKQYAKAGEFVVDKNLGIAYIKVNDGRLIPFNTELTHVVSHMFRSHYISNTTPAVPDTDFATRWYHTASPIRTADEAHIAKYGCMQYDVDGNGNKAYRWVYIYPKTVAEAVVIEGMGNGEENYTLDDFVTDTRNKNGKYDNIFGNLLKDLNDVLNSTTVSETDQVITTTGNNVSSITYTTVLPAKAVHDVFIDGVLLNRNQYTINTTAKTVTFSKLITVKSSVRIKSTYVTFTGLPLSLKETPLTK